MGLLPRKGALKMLKQKNGHSPVAAGRMTRVVTCVTDTIYNIVRESVFSNQNPLKSSRLGGLI